MNQEQPRIVVVGAGPSGYATALGLAELGLPCTMFEQNLNVAAGSRATGISRRALQLLTPSGIGEKVMEVATVQRANQAFAGDTELFLDWTPPEPGKYPRIVNIQQDVFEQMVVDSIGAIAPIDLRWGHRVTAVEPDEHGVALAVETADSTVRAHADWLVVCDGGRSFVRRALGLSLEGVRYETRFIVTDVRAELDLEPGVRRIWFDPPSNPGGTTIMHQQPFDVWRIDLGIPVDDPVDEALSAEGIRARLAAHLEMVGAGPDWELIWSGDYTASSVSLPEFRHGHVFFAGDAAHLLPIFGGRGLNSAIEDGFNLAWKLAAVIGGGVSEGLLDSYSRERKEGAVQNSAKAGIGAEVIAGHSPGALLLRRAALELMLEAHGELTSLLDHRTSDANTYSRGLLAGPAGENGGLDREIVLPDALVQVAGGGETYLADAMRPGFTVLDVVPDPDDLGGPGPRSLPPSLGGLPLSFLRVAVLPEPEAPQEPPLPAPGSYLLRPDRYVMARGRLNDVEAALEAAERLAFPADTAQAVG